MDASNVEKFADELNWCINQIELGLKRQSPDSRQTQESMKILKTLRSTKAPMVKKRQAMRNALGDYRKKMKEEEKKSRNSMKHSKFKSTHNMKFFGKSRFFRHSHTKEIVHEHEKEENRLLSINLNSLNLHQSLSDPVHSSTLQEESPSSSQNNVFQQSTIRCTDANADDCVPVPGAAGIVKESSCNDGANFKYLPSDNSFTFSFNHNLTASEERDAKTLQIASTLDGDRCLSNNANGSFHYEKSDNSFSFNFGM